VLRFAVFEFIVPIALDPVQKKVGFWSLLWDAWNATNGPTFDIAGLIAGLVAWKFASDQQVSAFVLIVVLCVAFAVIIPLVQAVRAALKLVGTATSEVVAVRKPHPPYGASKVVCVVKFSEAPPVGAMMAFYKQADNYDLPVGTGTLRHIQPQDRGAQVTLDKIYETPDVQSFVKDLCDGKADAIKALRVFATITIPHMPGVEAETKAEDTLIEEPSRPLSGAHTSNEG
jgi:hypothetical protein